MTSYEELKEKVLKLPTKHTERLFDGTLTKFYSKALNYWLKIDEDNLKILNKLLHHSFCVITGVDDILDNSKLRNGLPTTHVIYGMPFTLTTSYFSLIDIVQLLHKLHPNAVSLAMKQFKNVMSAMAMEIYWREQNICPSMEMFMKMTEEKTSALIVFYELMQLVSENKNLDYSKFIKIWALYLLLLNDYMVYKTNSEYSSNKKELGDVTEGKFTYPVVDAIHKEESNPQLLNILRMRTDDKNIKSYFVKIIKKHESLDKLKAKMDELRVKMKEELDAVGGNPVFERFLYLTKDVNDLMSFI